MDNSNQELNESDTTLRNESGRKKKKFSGHLDGFCKSKNTLRCCNATPFFGIIFLLLSIVILFFGKQIVEEKSDFLALKPKSEQTDSWLHPTVQPHLTVYVFHMTNPDQVLAGRKPILKEMGPFVYEAVTVRDSDDNMEWNEPDGLLTYRPRTSYTFVPELSAEGCKEPDKIFVTVPNIPFWTSMSKIKSLTGINISEIAANSSFQPFINVSVNGLLWGHPGNDLSCLNFSFAIPANSSKVKPKSEFVNSNCEFGIFQDRNATMREPITFFTGTKDLTKKGSIYKYNGESTLGWWKPGSHCDAVKGQDIGTFYPDIEKKHELNIFIDLMCRSIKLKFENESEHSGIKSFRFIPPKNELGSHNDPNPARKNPTNECFCMANLNYTCFKSGVYNLGPCRRDNPVPLAFSFPHFYQVS
jgi:scavenger receptor class B protein 1